MRRWLWLGAVMMLAGCASERHFVRDSVWPFGNPNRPRISSETAERALGRTPVVIPIEPQAGDVWPGAVAPMPTLSEIQRESNLPLGQDYTPSLPSPYPPGEAPPDADADLPGLNDGSLYAPVPGAAPPPAVPGHERE